MRTLGATILGLFLGLLAGIILTEIPGRILVAVGQMTSAGIGVDLALGYVMPACGIVGGVLGLAIERRMRTRERRP